VRSYSERHIFAARALSLRAAAERLIALVPEPIHEDDDWRCHELARAIGTRLRLEVVDGRFGGVEHSWLEVVDGCLDRRSAILDIYAVGSLPQVRVVDPRSPEGALFEPGPERADVRGHDLAALDHVFQGRCDHPDGFAGRTTIGEAFCERCGESWA
jgi:hypothetical protein